MSKDFGVTWRTYDVDRKQWACRWLQAGTDRSQHFTNDWFFGNYVDGEIRLGGSAQNERGGHDFHIAFANILAEHFTWTLAHSYDKGASRIEATGVIEARRQD